MRQKDIDFEKSQELLSYKLIDKLYKLQTNEIEKLSITSHCVYVEDDDGGEEQFLLSDLKKLHLNIRLSFNDEIFSAIGKYKYS